MSVANALQIKQEIIQESIAQIEVVVSKFVGIVGIIVAGIGFINQIFKAAISRAASFINETCTDCKAAESNIENVGT